MIQKVLAPDQFGNQVFRWDKQQRTISIVHDGNVLFYELGDDNDFHYIKSKSKGKPKPRGKKRTA